MRDWAAASSDRAAVAWTVRNLSPGRAKVAIWVGGMSYTTAWTAKPVGETGAMRQDRGRGGKRTPLFDRGGDACYHLDFDAPVPTQFLASAGYFMIILRRVVLIVAAAGAGIGGVVAQAPSKIYRVGAVTVGVPNTGTLGPGILQGFAARGYVVGRNLVFEGRAAQGNLDVLPRLLDELAADHVDAIMTTGYVAAVEAKERVPDIPVVVAGAGDPVTTGLVASFAHPGGHVTGVSDVAAELSGKRLQLLKEAIASVRRVAVLWNADDLAMTLRYKAVQDEGAKLGMTIVPLGVHAPDDFAVAFAEMTRDPPDAILLVTDVLTLLNRKLVIEYAAAHKLPAVYEYDNLTKDGGLMSYGPDNDALYDRAVSLVDRILKGAKPAELPLELPTRFRLAVNLKTAKALGIDIPESILLRADDVIE
jgi:putative tryptophan/tyrosine transport system substrate-binding protein